MRQLQLLALYALISTFVACGQSAQKESKVDVIKNKKSDIWKTLSESDYSIQYPDTFELDETGQMGLSLILLSKPTSQEDLFRENVNLLIQDLSGHILDLDEYVGISKEQIETMITDGKLIESKRLTDKNKEYERVIYTGRQGQFDLIWQQFYWVENKKAYILTLTCEINQYDNYMSVGEEIMNTFIIK